ncbi:MAG: bifunctional glutamate N-acetyltransferase/amino-acid acetyltransferase ArgJ [Hyphomicrobiaceae bacterium]
MHVSPFAPKSSPVVPAVEGVTFATAAAGIKYKNRTDLLLGLFAPGTTVAGVLTQSKTRSAPVDWCRSSLEGGSARALVVNSGNANAFTGKHGLATVEATAAAAAKVAGCKPGEVFIASTGVIGQPLNPKPIVDNLPDLAKRADASSWEAAARAIMTTDTFPKLATRTVRLGATDVVINGIAKGAGMIAPDMATMLSFVATDAPVAALILQALLAEGAGRTFNCISIDGDTSTSDTLIAFATGAAAKRGAAAITSETSPGYAAFKAAFHDLLRELALMVAKDGEGLTKFVALKVTGAESAAAARRIGLAIANSPLVKTALAGNDPNWGRIVMAVGKSGEAADRDKLAIDFGDIVVARAGEVHPGYKEEQGAAYFRRAELEIHVDVGVGRGEAVVWTCDLTADYVSINADYRS